MSSVDKLNYMEAISKPRKCPKCNEHKDGDRFYNHLSFYCIPCANEYSRDRRKKITNGEVYIIKKVKNNQWYRYLHSKGVKYCGRCNNVKPESEFNLDSDNIISGRYAHCRKCKKWTQIEYEGKKKQERIDRIRNTEKYKKYNKKIKKERPGIEKARENMSKFFQKMRVVRKKTFNQYHI